MKGERAIKRFEDKFRKDESGCWLWIGASWRGYGRFAMTKTNHMRAHRASWELYRGPIPEGLHVLHRCDVPGCVNPAHLFLGTHQDNMDDRGAKGRASGGRVPRRLSAEAVSKIRELKASGKSDADVACAFGVAKSLVWAIHNRMVWAHVP